MIVRAARSTSTLPGRRRGRAQLAGGLVALTLTTVGLGACSSSSRLSGAVEPPADARPPSGSRAPTADATLQAQPAHRVGAVRPERPITSRLPDGTVVPVQPVQTRPDGSLNIPHDIRTAGWWRGGSRLGDPFGSVLLAAHVDSFTQGLGPYSTLLSAHSGDRVVLASSHLRQAFSVVSLQVIPRGTLRQHPAFFSARGPRRLTMVTCAGPYVPSRGGYQNLAVITAEPVGPVVEGSLR